jgi:hypothetical protein
VDEKDIMTFRNMLSIMHYHFRAEQCVARKKKKFVQIHTYIVWYRETSRTYYTIVVNVGCFMLIVLMLNK